MCSSSAVSSAERGDTRKAQIKMKAMNIVLAASSEWMSFILSKL
jgi:hypothetical protein